MKKPLTKNDLDPKVVKMIKPINDNALPEYLDSVEKMMSSSKRPSKGFFWSFSFDKMIYDHEMISLKKYVANIRKSIDSNNKIDEKRREKTVISEMTNILAVKSLFDTKGWSNYLMISMNPTKTMLINMELSTGKFTSFIIKLEFPYFDYENGRYIIDDNYKYYHVPTKMWCLDYHQECCLPLKRKFDLNAIYEAVMQDATIETETSINPVSFKIFMESDIIQKVMKGAEMEQWLQFVKMMLIIMAIGIVILTIMVGYVISKIAKIK